MSTLQNMARTTLDIILIVGILIIAMIFTERRLVEVENKCEYLEKQYNVLARQYNSIVTAGPDEYYDIPLTVEEQNIVKEVCAHYDIPETIIYGIAYTESRFQSDAVNAAGNCIGLMQINKEYRRAWMNQSEFKHYLTTDLTNPITNLIVGIEAFRNWRDSTNTAAIEDILEYYNKGWSHKPQTSEYNYANKVIDYSKQLLKGGYNE